METAKKRQAKATKAQIDHMVDYFVLNPQVASGKFGGLNGHAHLRGSWEELTSQLNSMFTKEGDMKDVKSWKSTWRDNKSAVATKVAKIKRLRRATGNVAMPPNLSLTERDLKIIDIVGMEYMEGDAGVPDSFPEEENGGRTEVLQQEVECFGDIDEVLNSDDVEVECVVYDDCEMMTESQQLKGVTTSNSEQPGTSVPHTAITPTPIFAHRKGRAERLGRNEQAQSQFLAIAERQVACMEMFANALTRLVSQQEETNTLLKYLIEKGNSPHN